MNTMKFMLDSERYVIIPRESEAARGEYAEAQKAYRHLIAEAILDGRVYRLNRAKDSLDDVCAPMDMWQGWLRYEVSSVDVMRDVYAHVRKELLV